MTPRTPRRTLEDVAAVLLDTVGDLEQLAEEPWPELAEEPRPDPERTMRIAAERCEESARRLRKLLERRR